MLDYKKSKDACVICGNCMITVPASNQDMTYRCTEYNGEHTIERSIGRCSEFYLRRILQEKITKKEVKEIEEYFRRDLY